MAKQTSIEWFLQQMNNDELYDDEGYAYMEIWNKIIEQAKQMHKQEIVNAFNTADHIHHDNGDIDKDGHEYYDETYGNK